MDKKDYIQSEIDPQLKELLELLQQIEPRDPEAVSLGKERFLSEAKNTLNPSQIFQYSGVNGRLRKEHPEKEKRIMNIFTGRLASLAIKAALILLVVLFGGAGVTAYAAQASLPGDALYSVKTTLENARIALALDAEAQTDLHLEFAQRRLDEISDLIEAGRYNAIARAAMEFETQIRNAMRTMEVVASTDRVRAESLAVRISTALSAYAESLSRLLARTPEDVRPMLVQAIESSQRASLSSHTRPGEFEFFGFVEVQGNTSWTISTIVVEIANSTEIKGNILEGDLVKVHARMTDTRTVVAREIELVDWRASGDQVVTHDQEIEFTGVVEDIQPGVWTIDGRQLSISAMTEVKGAILVGDVVKIHALVRADGSLEAREIELIRRQGQVQPGDAGEVDDGQGQEGVQQEIQFTGVVEAISADTWTVAGRVISITLQTEIKGNLQVGQQAKVHALVMADGRLVAREIEPVDPEGWAGQELRFSGMVESISASSWTIGGKTVMITAQTDIRGFIKVGDVVEVRAIVHSDGSLSARRIELEQGQQLSEVRFTGVVESIGQLTWTISGQTVTVNLLTDVRDFIQVGDVVEVRAILGVDGILVASRIRLDN
jgi:hypothetical protein